MYDKNKVISSISVGIAVLGIACAGWFAYALSGAKAGAREIRAKYTELQRLSAATKATAETGLAKDREALDRTRDSQQRVDREYREVTETGEGISQNLRSIIAESEALEYIRLDNSGHKWYRTIRRFNLGSSEVKE